MRYSAPRLKEGKTKKDTFTHALPRLPTHYTATRWLPFDYGSVAFTWKRALLAARTLAKNCRFSCPSARLPGLYTSSRYPFFGTSGTPVYACCLLQLQHSAMPLPFCLLHCALLHGTSRLSSYCCNTGAGGRLGTKRRGFARHHAA